MYAQKWYLYLNTSRYMRRLILVDKVTMFIHEDLPAEV